MGACIDRCSLDSQEPARDRKIGQHLIRASLASADVEALAWTLSEGTLETVSH